MATKAITIKQKTATGYDTIHPETSLPQVKDVSKLLSLLQNYRSDLAPEQTIPIDFEGVTYKVRLSDLSDYISGTINAPGVIVSAEQPADQREGDFWYEIA